MKSAFDLSEQNSSIDHKIVVGLERISEVFRVMLWNESKKTGLSPIQIQIMVFLHFHKHTFNSPSYLAKEFNVTKATITDSVRVLVEKGLIEKKPDPDDARRYAVSLTASGRKIASQSASFSDDLVAAIGKVPNALKPEILQGLYQMIESLNRESIVSAQRMCPNCQFFENGRDGDYCHYLKQPLVPSDLRLDCPEFQSL